MLNKLLELLNSKRESPYVEKTQEDLYRGIESKTDMPKEDIAKIGGVESQHGTNTKSTGSARGQMQIMPNLAKTLRPGSEKTLGDINTQEDLASDFLNLNTPTIKELASKNNLLDSYLMYNLGKGRGTKMLQAKDEDDITKILPSEVIRANPRLYKYKTVGEAKKAIQEHLNKRGADFKFTPTAEDFFKKEGEE